jgi:methylphosphotriester-DNA--protein-cysteine methyltransferase
LYEFIDMRRNGDAAKIVEAPMRRVAPSARLAPFVSELLVVEVGEETTRVRLPEPGLVLGVRYAGAATLLEDGAAIRLPDATLAGLATRARRMRTAAGGAVVLARFRPGGAAQFFDEPLHELLGATRALEDLLPRSEVDRVTSRVHEASSDAERAGAVESLLLARLRPRSADPVVVAAVQALEGAHGAVPIQVLARKLGISQDPLEKRFRRAVGASPKQLASLLRLRHAIDTYRPGAPLARLALDAGYFDQSHFSRELRAATGEAPGRFFRAGEYR